MPFTLTDAPADYKGEGGFKEYAIIPDGTRLTAVIERAVEQDAPWHKVDAQGNRLPEKERQVSFKFRTEYDDQDRVLFGNIKTDFFRHPDCRLYTWTQEILGAELPANFQMRQADDGSFPDLEQQRVDIVVALEEYDKKVNGQVVTDDAGNPVRVQKNKVRDVIRSTGAPAPSGYNPADEPF